MNYIYSSTVLLYSPPNIYSPSTSGFLFAPFRKNDVYNKYRNQIVTTCKKHNYNCTVVNIRDRIKKYFTYTDINKFKAAIVFPYAVLSYYLADLITTAIPMFVPSPSFIVESKIGVDMKARNKYYCGNRFQEPPKHPKSKHFYSPESYSKKATEYWLQFASYYTLCSVVFTSIPHLVQLMKTTNYSKVYECNLNYRKHIINHNRMEWSKLFQKININRRMPKSIKESLDWYGERSFY